MFIISGAYGLYANYIGNGCIKSPINGKLALCVSGLIMSFSIANINENGNEIEY